jgi:hypothetical protein
MKIQQRPFVVEVKSRRRALATPKSIWGNMDLKAVALEAQDDAPHLFKVTEPPQAAVPDSAEDGVSETSNGTAIESEFSNPTVPDDAIQRDRSDEEPLPSATDPVEANVSLRLKRPKKRRRSADVHPIAAAPATGDIGSETDIAPGDELSMLMAENGRLKEQLRERLIYENERLRKLLVRSGT